MKNRSHDDELQISSFIKEPASLKLLILAGTNIKAQELSSISKCSGLIKLDLSGNFLSDMPIKFHNFSQLKILYLHDNQLTSVDIRKTSLEYVSLFGNLIKQNSYRRTLIENNSELKGIDFNIITQKEIYNEECRKIEKLPIYSEIKWPIVEISTTLEHQEDYLNLLKAEIFVINNVQKRTSKIEQIQNIFQGILGEIHFQHKDQSIQVQDLIKPSVIKAAKKWIEYTKLRKKLRLILEKKNKEYLLLNRIQRKKKERSQEVNEIFSTFLPMVRIKMKARQILERNSRSFRKFIPANKALQNQFLGFDAEKDYSIHPAILYFRESQQDYLSKVCLYIKRLFFQQKEYDLCDEFNNLFHPTARRYLMIRKKGYLENENSWLVNTIHETCGCILKQEGIDRKHFLYSRNGHKGIKIKSLSKFKLKESEVEKIERISTKLDYIEQKYDRLLEYEVKDHRILTYVLKIVRYINAGNSSSILSNQTAYFQTEVITKSDMEDQKEMRVRMHLGLQFFTKRVIAVNVIQRFWRKKLSQRKDKIKIIQELKLKRSENLIQKWLNGLIFNHRMLNCKMISYQKSVWRTTQLYIHLDIYMNMPIPTNFLRFQNQLTSKDDFYSVLHTGTEVQIVEYNRRKWMKMIFQNPSDAFVAHEKVKKFTYRYYYNGFSIKLFSLEEIKSEAELLLYERKVEKIFSIEINVSKGDKTIGTKNLWIENPKPFFVWSQIQPTQSIQQFTALEKKNTNISIFIYNKHQRPLKVSCEFFWVNPESIYSNRKLSATFRSLKKISESMPVQKNSPLIPVKYGKGLDFSTFNEPGELSLLEAGYRKGKKKYHLDKSHGEEIRSRRQSLAGSRNSSLMKSHRTRIVSDHKLDLLSETLNIRKK